MLDFKTLQMKLTSKALFIYLLFCLPSFVKAQQKLDTIFYNQKWIETNVREEASFYRIAILEKNHYLVKDYYINDTIQMVGVFSDIRFSVKNGLFTYYDTNGKISASGIYKNNLKEGKWNDFKEGQIWLTINYSKNEYHGSFTSFYKNGKIKRKDIYKRGKLRKGKCFNAEGGDTIYYLFEISPEFVGGENAMYDFLGKYTNYPEEARKAGIEGRVFIRFCIDENGEIKEPTTVSKTPEILNKSAIETLLLMPKWTPGKQDGIPVKVYFTLPFAFNLN